MFIFQLQTQLPDAMPRGRAIEPALPEVAKGVAELIRIKRNLEDTQNYWNSVNPEILKAFREYPESLKIPGFTTKVVSAGAHGSDVYSVKFQITPEGDTKLNSKTVGKLLDDAVGSQLGKLEQMRKEGWLASINIDAELDKKGGMFVSIVSNAGVRAIPQDNTEVFIEDVLTPTGRKQAWEKIFKNIGIVDVFRPAASSLEEQTLHHLRMLKTVYQGSNDKVMASFVQGLIAVTNLKKVDETLEYAEFGRVTAEQLKFAPEVIRKQMEKINDFAQYVPSGEEVQARQARTRHIDLSPNLNAFLNVEYEPQVFSGLVVNLAAVELKESKRYALEKGGTNVDPMKASEVVRSYFVEHSPGAYDFLDNPKGIAGGIAIRRTNCSNRAVIAFEMFKAMNVKAGTEFMMAQENGQDVVGTQSHMVNWIELPDGKRRYFDFGIDEGKPYGFDSDKPIITHYLGPSNGDPNTTVRTTILSSDPEIYGYFLKEPIRSELNSFFEKFSKENVNLADFLKAHGEEIFNVQRIARYLRFQDQLLNTKNLDAWLDGSREKLAEAYPGYFH